MSDGQFSYEHPYVYYSKSNGAILMKPNACYISKVSLHLVKIDEGITLKTIHHNL